MVDTASILKHYELKTEAIDMTPDRSMLPKSGKVGYTLTQAVAELVDNSIDARVSNEELLINIVVQSDYIKVEDNGTGMGKQDIGHALSLGHSNKKDQLGEFGIGMKASCTSLGKKFRITTTKDDLKEYYIYDYDEDLWNSNENKTDWQDYIRIATKQDANDHGTTIEIEKLTRSINKARKNDLLKDLGNRFAPLILNKSVIIKVNNEECISEEPVLTEEGKTPFKITINENTIYGWYGLLKHGSNKGFYGFSTFRRGRMITNYDKLGIPSHPTVSRIIGEIHMNHIPVSSSKRGWETESDDYIKAEEALEKEFRELVAKARKTSMDEKLDQGILDKTDLWKAEIVKAAQPLFNRLNDIAGQKKKRSLDPSDPIDELIIERRDPNLEKIHQEITIKEENTRDPKKKQKIISHSITINGKRFMFKHAYANLGKEKGWKDYYHKEGEPIEVYTNIDFPAYSITKDIPFYAAIHIAEALSEIIVKANGERLDKASDYKENMLRKASEIVDQFKN